MNARLHWWLHEWDWRPLARLLMWSAIAVVAVKRSGCAIPNPRAVAREWVLAFLLTGGLMTYAQLELLNLLTRAYFWLDGWTFAVMDRALRPLTARAPFAVGFAAAAAAQVAAVAALLRAAPWVLTYISSRL